MKDGKFVILAADDEVELLDALELFMGKENMVMVKAASGVAALNLFHNCDCKMCTFRSTSYDTR